MSALEGGCLCGKIRYTASKAAAPAVVCHCTHCQKASGAAFSVNVLVLDADISITGEMGAYRDSGESGKSLLRRFCATCGSSIGSQAESLPGMFILKAGTLDDHSSIAPNMQMWTRSAQPWVKLDLKALEKGR